MRPTFVLIVFLALAVHGCGTEDPGTDPAPTQEPDEFAGSPSGTETNAGRAACDPNGECGDGMECRPFVDGGTEGACYLIGESADAGTTP